MRATEIIRNILDLIDEIDGQSDPENIEANVTITAPDTDINRFKQIAGLVSDKEYSTAPDPKVADIDAVTVDAGGGMNGPKHPADIRGSTQAMYPGKVYGA